MSISPLRVLATFKVKPDKVDAFKSLMGSIREASRAEPGCIAYVMQQSLADPSTFVFVEEWASEAAMTNHLTSPHVQNITPALLDMLAAPPAVDRYQAVW